MLRFVPALGLATVAAGLAVPSPEQTAWQDMEVGAMITFNLQTLCLEKGDPGASTQRCQKLGYVPTLEATAAWNPSALDTDQWVQSAADFGAKYIVLVVDHMTGFTLWDTSVHNFSIAHTQWRGGGGDILTDFVASCKKYGLKPGVFYSTHYNWYLGVNNYKVGWPPLGGKTYTQAEYDSMASAQLKELFTNYGPLLEVWFDGGINPALTPKAAATVTQHAPRAICHSCNGFNRDVGVRWMGNEEARMPIPSWAASNGTVQGDPHGPMFIPPSSDSVLREHYWFWYKDSEHTMKTTARLVQDYLNTVGHAANLILNMAPDTTGAVPAVDVARYKTIPTALDCLFAKEVYAANNTKPLTKESATVTFDLPKAVSLQNVSLTVQEDLTHGQAINTWSVKLTAADGRSMTYSSVGVGHKRIVNLVSDKPIAVTQLTFTASALFADSAVLSRVKIHNWAGTESCDKL